MDWEEVTSVDDESTVVLNDIGGVLSEEQVRVFSAGNRVDTNNLSRESLVSYFAEAKEFVYTHCSQQ